MEHGQEEQYNVLNVFYCMKYCVYELIVPFHLHMGGKTQTIEKRQGIDQMQRS